MTLALPARKPGEVVVEMGPPSQSGPRAGPDRGQGRHPGWARTRSGRLAAAAQDDLSESGQSRHIWGV